MRIPIMKKITVLILFISILPLADFNTGPGFFNMSPLLAAGKKKKVRRKKRRRVRSFALNFKDVEISEFVNIMGQLIGKNIILSDRVKGKISISSARKVPVSEAYFIMKSILEVKGLAVIETGKIIKILPIQDAIKKNISIVIDGKKKGISARDEKPLTYLLELKNADAEEVSRSLIPLKSKFTSIVLYRTRNTIIFSGTSSEIRGLIKIAKALDVPSEEETDTGQANRGGYIHVVNLENANAEDLAAVLSRIPFSDTARINRTPVMKKRVRQSKKTKRVTRSHGAVTRQKSKLSIVANKDTNSLIITAKPEEFRQILNIIKQLDIVREQVLIEAMIVEVNMSSGWGFGVDWMMGDKNGDHIFGGSNIMSSSLPNYNLPEGFGTNTKLPVPLGQGFQLGYLNDKNVLGFALLNASATDSNFNILSTPQILTIDNNEAEINVGEQIAVPTNNRITDQNTTFQTFEYKDVALKLKITPHITNKNRITLDLYQEVNSILTPSITTSSGTIIPPKIGKRDIKTKVTVMDGKTIVIGGLIKNEKKTSVTKIPLLGDIPLLGWLFKHKTVDHTKTNLLIFITPYIVTKQEKLDAITKRKREIQRRMRAK